MLTFKSLFSPTGGEFTGRLVAGLGALLLPALLSGAEYLPTADRLPGGVLWQRGHVGVQGGVPDSTSMTVFTTMASGSTAAQINSAITACPTNQVVELGAGNFTLASRLSMKTGVVLRGQGTNTVLSFTGGSGFITGLIHFGGPLVDPPSVVKNWTSGLAQGSSNLTLDSVSNLQVGDLIGLDQLNDPVLGVQKVAAFTSREAGARGQQQFVRVTAVSGSTITISHPVLMTNYNSVLVPQVFRIGIPLVNAGVENLLIVNADQDNADYNIYFQGAWNCWVKDVVSVGAEKAHVRTYQAGRVEVRHSTFRRTKSYASESYGMNITYASHCLVEDNIFEEVTSPINLWGGSSGNVVAYNYAHNMRYDQSPAWLSECMFTHGCHPTMNLIEGNHFTSIYWDFIWGSASHNTAFRNRVTGWESNKTGNTFPIVVERNNRFENFVGNVLGTDGYHARYLLANAVQAGADDYIYVFGYAGTDQGNLTSYDVQVTNTVLLRGNFNYATDSVPASESLSGATLADSWYMTNRPTWFGNRPWPWVEPAIPSRSVPTNLPAGYRFVFGVDSPSGEVTPPTAPKALNAVPAGPNQINLVWGASSNGLGPISYRVERSQGSGSTLFAQVAAPTTTNYSDAGLSPGTVYNYRVRAVDAAANLGPYSATTTATTSEPAVNQLPTVSLTAPAAGASGYAPTTVTLNAVASDADGSVTKVEFFEGLNKVGEDTSAPYSVTLNASAARGYVLTAVAHDNSGAAVLSASVVFTAVQPGISSAQRLPNGSFNIVAAGTAGRINTVHVSSDLVNWTQLTNLVNVGGTVNLVDAEAAIVSRRFYRIWAETLFLSNVVGFARVTVPPGYSIIANQFIQPTNTVAAVITGVPGGTSLSKFRPTTGDFAINNYDPIFLSWLDPNQSFATGDTGFLLNPTTNSFALTFQGQVPQGLLSSGLPAGYSMVGSMLPQTGQIQSQLGFPGAAGDTVFLYRDGRYRTSQYDPLVGGWDFEPNVNVGEGFFLFKFAATNWVRAFSAFN